MKDIIEQVLRGAGLSDVPAECDSDIHSWRCSYPETYGDCTCFADLIDDLAKAIG